MKHSIVYTLYVLAYEVAAGTTVLTRGLPKTEPWARPNGEPKPKPNGEPWAMLNEEPWLKPNGDANPKPLWPRANPLWLRPNGETPAKPNGAPIIPAETAAKKSGKKH